MIRTNLFLRSVSIVLLQSFILQQVSFADVIKPTIQNPLSKPVVSLELPDTIATIEDTYTSADRSQGSGVRSQRTGVRKLTPDASTLSAGKLIYLLQDAHTNESAQYNLAKTLDIILKKENSSPKPEARSSEQAAGPQASASGLKYVFTEAGIGDNSLAFLRPFRPLAERTKLAKSYIKKGILHGAEYLDLTSEHNFTLWGVENPDLYIQSIQDYKYVAKERERFDLYLKKIASTLDTLNNRLLNPSLQTFLKESKLYHQDRLALTEYFQALLRESQIHNIDLKAYPHLTKLKDLKTQEDNLDFSKANEEHLKAVESLPKDIQQELKDISQVKAGKILQNKKEERAYFQYLEEKLNQRIDASGQRTADRRQEGLTPASSTLTPELKKYFQYLRSAKDIQAKEILSELKALEENIFSLLTKTEDEKMLLKSEQALRYLNKLFTFTLTPDEYREYKNLIGSPMTTSATGGAEGEASAARSAIRHEHGGVPQVNSLPAGRQGPVAQFGIEHLTGFLNKKIMDLETYYERSLFLEKGYEEMVRRAEDFYELTFKRDEYFIKKVLEKLNEDRGSQMADGGHAPRSNIRNPQSMHQSAVLITGGFHTTNLKELLKKQNISFVSITPQLLQETNIKKYESILLNQVTTLKNPQPLTIKPNGSTVGILALVTLAMAGNLAGKDAVQNFANGQQSLQALLEARGINDTKTSERVSYGLGYLSRSKQSRQEETLPKQSTSPSSISPFVIPVGMNKNTPDTETYERDAQLITKPAGKVFEEGAGQPNGKYRFGNVSQQFGNKLQPFFSKGPHAVNSTTKETSSQVLDSPRSISLGARLTEIKILIADKFAGENTPDKIRELAASFGANVQALESAGLEVPQEYRADKQQASAWRESQLREIIVRDKPSIVIVRSDTTTFRNPEFVEFASQNGVKAIVRAGVDVGNIDTKSTADQNIAVVPTYGNANSVANLALRFLLASLGGIHEPDTSLSDVSDDAEFSKAFDVSLSDFLKAQDSSIAKGRGTVLPGQNEKVFQKISREQATRLLGGFQNKTIGLVGFGKIAQAFAEKLNTLKQLTGIQFDIIAISPKIIAKDPRSLSRAAELGVLTAESEDDFNSRADIVSIHVPETARINLTNTKKGLVAVINTARQAIVSASDLNELVEKRGVYYFADVDQESQLDQLRWENPDQAIVTPHIAASTQNAANGVEDATIPTLRTIIKSLLGQDISHEQRIEIVNGVEIEPLSGARLSEISSLSQADDPLLPPFVLEVGASIQVKTAAEAGQIVGFYVAANQNQKIIVSQDEGSVEFRAGRRNAAKLVFDHLNQIQGDSRIRLKRTDKSLLIKLVSADSLDLAAGPQSRREQRAPKNHFHAYYGQRNLDLFYVVNAIILNEINLGRAEAGLPKIGLSDIRQVDKSKYSRSFPHGTSIEEVKQSLSKITVGPDSDINTFYDEPAEESTSAAVDPLTSGARLSKNMEKLQPIEQGIRKLEDLASELSLKKGHDPLGRHTLEGNIETQALVMLKALRESRLISTAARASMSIGLEAVSTHARQAAISTIPGHGSQQDSDLIDNIVSGVGGLGRDLLSFKKDLYIEDFNVLLSDYNRSLAKYTAVWQRIHALIYDESSNPGLPKINDVMDEVNTALTDLIRESERVHDGLSPSLLNMEDHILALPEEYTKDALESHLTQLKKDSEEIRKAVIQTFTSYQGLLAEAAALAELLYSPDAINLVPAEIKPVVQKKPKKMETTKPDKVIPSLPEVLEGLSEFLPTLREKVNAIKGKTIPSKGAKDLAAVLKQYWILNRQLNAALKDPSHADSLRVLYQEMNTAASSVKSTIAALAQGKSSKAHLLKSISNLEDRFASLQRGARLTTAEQTAGGAVTRSKVPGHVTADHVTYRLDRSGSRLAKSYFSPRTVINITNAAEAISNLAHPSELIAVAVRAGISRKTLVDYLSRFQALNNIVHDAIQGVTRPSTPSLAASSSDEAPQASAAGADEQMARILENHSESRDRTKPFDLSREIERLTRLGKRYVNSRDRYGRLAEDIVQEAWVSAIQSVNNFKTGMTAEGWFITIVDRRLVDHIRKVNGRTGKKSGILVGGLSDDVFGSMPDTFALRAFKHLEDGLDLDNLSAELDPIDARVVHLHRNGLFNGEIGKILGFNESRASQRLKRARTKMRNVSSASIAKDVPTASSGARLAETASHGQTVAESQGEGRETGDRVTLPPDVAAPSGARMSSDSSDLGPRRTFLLALLGAIAVAGGWSVLWSFASTLFGEHGDIDWGDGALISSDSSSPKQWKTQERRFDSPQDLGQELSIYITRSSPGLGVVFSIEADDAVLKFSTKLSGGRQVVRISAQNLGINRVDRVTSITASYGEYEGKDQINSQLKNAGELIIDGIGASGARLTLSVDEAVQKIMVLPTSLGAHQKENLLLTIANNVNESDRPQLQTRLELNFKDAPARKRRQITSLIDWLEKEAALREELKSIGINTVFDPSRISKVYPELGRGYHATDVLLRIKHDASQQEWETFKSFISKRLVQKHGTSALWIHEKLDNQTVLREVLSWMRGTEPSFEEKEKRAIVSTNGQTADFRPAADEGKFAPIVAGQNTVNFDQGSFENEMDEDKAEREVTIRELSVKGIKRIFNLKKIGEGDRDLGSHTIALLTTLRRQNNNSEQDLWPSLIQYLSDQAQQQGINAVYIDWRLTPMDFYYFLSAGLSGSIHISTQEYWDPQENTLIKTLNFHPPSFAGAQFNMTSLNIHEEQDGSKYAVMALHRKAEDGQVNVRIEVPSSYEVASTAILLLEGKLGAVLEKYKGSDIEELKSILRTELKQFFSNGARLSSASGEIYRSESRELNFGPSPILVTASKPVSEHERDFVEATVIIWDLWHSSKWFASIQRPSWESPEETVKEVAQWLANLNFSLPKLSRLLADGLSLVNIIEASSLNYFTANSDARRHSPAASDRAAGAGSRLAQNRVMDAGSWILDDATGVGLLLRNVLDYVLAIFATRGRVQELLRHAQSLGIDVSGELYAINRQANPIWREQKQGLIAKQSDIYLSLAKKIRNHYTWPEFVRVARLKQSPIQIHLTRIMITTMDQSKIRGIYTGLLENGQGVFYLIPTESFPRQIINPLSIDVLSGSRLTEKAEQVFNNLFYVVNTYDDALDGDNAARNALASMLLTMSIPDNELMNLVDELLDVDVTVEALEDNVESVLDDESSLEWDEGEVSQIQREILRLMTAYPDRRFKSFEVSSQELKDFLIKLGGQEDNVLDIAQQLMEVHPNYTLAKHVLDVLGEYEAKKFDWQEGEAEVQADTDNSEDGEQTLAPEGPFIQDNHPSVMLYTAPLVVVAGIIAYLYFYHPTSYIDILHRLNRDFYNILNEVRDLLGSRLSQQNNASQLQSLQTMAANTQTEFQQPAIQDPSSTNRAAGAKSGSRLAESDLELVNALVGHAAGEANGLGDFLKLHDITALKSYARHEFKPGEVNASGSIAFNARGDVIWSVLGDSRNLITAGRTPDGIISYIHAIPQGRFTSGLTLAELKELQGKLRAFSQDFGPFLVRLVGGKLDFSHVPADSTYPARMSGEYLDLANKPLIRDFSKLQVLGRYEDTGPSYKFASDSQASGEKYLRIKNVNGVRRPVMLKRFFGPERRNETYVRDSLLNAQILSHMEIGAPFLGIETDNQNRITGYYLDYADGDSVAHLPPKGKNPLADRVRERLGLIEASPKADIRKTSLGHYLVLDAGHLGNEIDDRLQNFADKYDELRTRMSGARLTSTTTPGGHVSPSPENDQIDLVTGAPVTGVLATGARGKAAKTGSRLSEVTIEEVRQLLEVKDRQALRWFPFLSVSESKVLALRYGLNGETKTTLKIIAQIAFLYGISQKETVTVERIRRYEFRGLRRLASLLTYESMRQDADIHVLSSFGIVTPLHYLLSERIDKLVDLLNKGDENLIKIAGIGTYFLWALALFREFNQTALSDDDILRYAEKFKTDANTGARLTAGKGIADVGSQDRGNYDLLSLPVRQAGATPDQQSSIRHPLSANLAEGDNEAGSRLAAAEQSHGDTVTWSQDPGLVTGDFLTGRRDKVGSRLAAIDDDIVRWAKKEGFAIAVHGTEEGETASNVIQGVHDEAINNIAEALNQEVVRGASLIVGTERRNINRQLSTVSAKYEVDLKREYEISLGILSSLRGGKDISVDKLKRPIARMSTIHSKAVQEIRSTKKRFVEQISDNVLNPNQHFTLDGENDGDGARLSLSQRTAYSGPLTGLTPDASTLTAGKREFRGARLSPLDFFGKRFDEVTRHRSPGHQLLGHRASEAQSELSPAAEFILPVINEGPVEAVSFALLKHFLREAITPVNVAIAQEGGELTILFSPGDLRRYGIAIEGDTAHVKFTNQDGVVQAFPIELKNVVKDVDTGDILQATVSAGDALMLKRAKDQAILTALGVLLTQNMDTGVAFDVHQSILRGQFDSFALELYALHQSAAGKMAVMTSSTELREEIFSRLIKLERTFRLRTGSLTGLYSADLPSDYKNLVVAVAGEMEPRAGLKTLWVQKAVSGSVSEFHLELGLVEARVVTEEDTLPQEYLVAVSIALGMDLKDMVAATLKRVQLGFESEFLIISRFAYPPMTVRPGQEIQFLKMLLQQYAQAA